MEGVLVGTYQEPYSGGNILVRAFENATDSEISKKINWSIEYSTKEGCLGVLDPPIVKKPSFLSSDPVTITITKSPSIPPSIYQYRVKGTNPADGSVAYSEYFTFIVKPQVNTAPVLDISRNIDTTLAPGV